MAADSGMETCPSPEIADSRKRPLDCDTENGATKRSHYGSGIFIARCQPLLSIFPDETNSPMVPSVNRVPHQHIYRTHISQPIKYTCTMIFSVPSSLSILAGCSSIPLPLYFSLFPSHSLPLSLCLCLSRDHPLSVPLHIVALFTLSRAPLTILSCWCCCC